MNEAAPVTIDEQHLRELEPLEDLPRIQAAEGVVTVMATDGSREVIG